MLPLTGAALLIFVFADFRRAVPGGEAWIDFSYPEILGLIGLSYFAVCLLCIPTRRWRLAPLAGMVVVVAYKTYFRSGNAIGHKIGMADDDNYAGRIVGVVRASKYSAVGESRVPKMYFVAAQFPPSAEMNIQVRARGDATALIPAMRRIVAELNPDIPIVRPMTQRSQFDETYRRQRIFAVMGSFFGFIAALLVAAGVYGMHSFHVSRRTQEIGVRMAFGASHSNVLAMVLKENVRVLAIGLTIGTPLTFLEDCDLRRWGLKLAERGGKRGKRRAIIAVARKLAVLLHHLWISCEAYEPLHNARKRKLAA